MEIIGLQTGARQPGPDRTFAVPKDADGAAEVQTFGQRREHFGDPMRGGFQTIEHGVSSSAGFGPTGLAAEVLDPFLPPVVAVANERVNIGIGIAP